jgi:hypothetical protein
MNSGHDPDERLLRAFTKLRHSDEKHVPSFDKLASFERAPARRSRLRGWSAAGSLAAAAAVILLAYQQLERPEMRFAAAPAASVAPADSVGFTQVQLRIPKSDLDFLLARSAALTEVPHYDLPSHGGFR